jgi:DNA-binding MarR family transcriptional regulator
VSNRQNPSDLHAHLGYWLRTVSNAVSRSFASRVEAEGVTVAEWAFLRVLYDIDGAAPTVLADRMGMTKGAISKLADRLVEKDLIEREPKPDSKRGQRLALKPAAKMLVPGLAELADRNDADFFGMLEPSERQTLEAILRKIVAAKELKNMPTD